MFRICNLASCRSVFCNAAVWFCLAVIAPQAIGQVSQRDHPIRNVSEGISEPIELHRFKVLLSNGEVAKNANVIAVKRQSQPIHVFNRTPLTSDGPVSNISTESLDRLKGKLSREREKLTPLVVTRPRFVLEKMMEQRTRVASSNESEKDKQTLLKGIDHDIEEIRDHEGFDDFVLPLRSELNDRNGTAVTGLDWNGDEAEPPKANVVRVETDETGEFEVLNLYTYAFFVQSEDGTEAAFVPPGRKGVVRLRPCGKLKLDKSVLKGFMPRDEQSRFSVTIVWRNCFAGSYPQFAPPQLPGGEIDPSASPRDWRISPYFEMITTIDHIGKSDKLDWMLNLPPGEVSISVLTDMQKQKLLQFAPRVAKYKRHHFPATAGIHTISESKLTVAQLKLGSCLTGQIVEAKSDSPLPSWGKGGRSNVIRFRNSKLKLLEYPKRDPTITIKNGSYEAFHLNATKIAKVLSTEDGRRSRIQYQAGVYTAWIDNDNHFITVPLPAGGYLADVTNFPARTGNQSRAVKSANGGEFVALQPDSRNNSGGESKSCFLRTATSSANSVFEFRSDENEIVDGGKLVVVPHAKKDVSKKADTEADREMQIHKYLYEVKDDKSGKVSKGAVLYREAPKAYLLRQTTGNKGFDGNFALLKARQAVAVGDTRVAEQILAMLGRQESIDMPSDSSDSEENVRELIKWHKRFVKRMEGKDPFYNDEAPKFLLAQASELRIRGDVRTAELLETKARTFPEVAKGESKMPFKIGLCPVDETSSQIDSESDETETDETESRIALAVKHRQDLINAYSEPSMLLDTSNELLQIQPSLMALKSNLVDAQLKLTSAQSRYENQHPQIVKAKLAVADVKKKITKQLPTIIQNLDSQIQWTQDESALENRLEKLQAILVERTGEKYHGARVIMNEARKAIDQSKLNRASTLLDAAKRYVPESSVSSQPSHGSVADVEEVLSVLRSTDDADAKKALMGELRDLVRDQFDSKVGIRDKELKELEAKLVAARKKFRARIDQREAIIERRVKKLLGK